MISGPARAFETGHPALASSANFWKSSALIPGTVPSVSSSILWISNPPSIRRRYTVASVSMLSESWPASPRISVNAIEKQAAWAAPSSSSGFGVLAVGES